MPTAVLPTFSPEPTLTVTAVPPTPTLQPAFQPTNPPTTTPVPTSTPDPYAAYTIDILAARSYGGGLLEIIDTLETNDSFTRYLITYPSDGLTIYGFMNVPNEGDDFPIAIVLHGYIDPDAYETLAYTRRYADSLADAGYFVIHPNFRNYPPSDSGPDFFRTGYAIDVLNLIAIIREQSQDPTGILRRANADDINLWGHSMGGGVALRVMTVNNADYVKTAVLYGSMSGDEKLNYERIQMWSGGQNGSFELAALPETLQAISPIYHLERINASVSIHHSETDDVVPPVWSDDLCQRLQAIDHSVECFMYPNQPHTFRGDGDALFMARVVAFFNAH
ncbi:MAG: alpha/beta fold hydrolase [Ardenticatenaceae bacterium]|nr:alpha/beta fold hydrolase [Ardenticatenaceae bacterium]